MTASPPKRQMPVPRQIELELTANRPIQCRVYLPQLIDRGSPCKVAIVAHPYAPLGGTFDDPVVLALSNSLASLGFVVGTFNFGKRPSWTLKPEVADYAAVTACLVHYISLITPSAAEIRRLSLLLAGYSYGSFVASRVPAAAEIYTKLTEQDRARLEESARELARQNQDTLYFDPGHAPLASFESAETSYLLVSPLLAPVTYALAPLHGTVEACPGKTLAVFGTQDVFTSSKRLVAWARSSGYEAVEVQGADHFWRHPHHEEQLLKALDDWVAGARTKGSTADAE